MPTRTTRRSFLCTASGLAGAAALSSAPPTTPNAIDAFLDLRVGLSIHWGPSSQSGLEISWSRGEHGNRAARMPVAVYDSLYRTFSPTKFDAQEWVRMARRWGMRYVVPTGKHHDGFALWHSRVSPYTMAQTPFRRDLMKELSVACTGAGLMFGSYYSNLDWYHPDWTPYEPLPGQLIPPQSDSPRLERYLAYMKAQLAELIREYRVRVLQFDGEWPRTWTHEIGSEMYRYIKSFDPSIIVNSRIDVARRDTGEGGLWDQSKYVGDYEERERMVTWVDHKGPDVRRWTTHPWQAWVSMDRAQWNWNPKPDLLTADEIVRDICVTVGNNGSYCLNIGPMPDGSFSPDQIRIMDKVGVWLAAHKTAIYRTRGGPFRSESSVSTQNGRRVYLHILDPALTQIWLRDPGKRLETVRMLNGPTLCFRQTEQGISVTAPQAPGPVRVLEMRFASPPDTAV